MAREVKLVANEMRDAIHNGDLKRFHATAKRGCERRGATAVSGTLGGDGVLLTKFGLELSTREEKEDRWLEHFDDILNVPSRARAGPATTLLDSISSVATNADIDRSFSREEMTVAIGEFKQNKATGADDIPIEILMALIRKDSGSTEEEILSGVLAEFNAALETGELPQSHKDVILVPIFKKGDTRDCGNYRGIALMNHFGKLLERMILNRLQPHFEDTDAIPYTQCGFR